MCVLFVIYKSNFQCILQTRTFISSHVVMAVIVLGAPSKKHEDWGWDKILFSFFANNKFQNASFCKESLFPLVWHTKMSSVFGTGRSTNSMAWKIAKWARFVLVLTIIHMLKKSRIFVYRIWKVRQTTSNWIVRIPNEATSAIIYRSLQCNSCLKYPDSFICFRCVQYC